MENARKNCKIIIGLLRINKLKNIRDENALIIKELLYFPSAKNVYF